MRDTAKRRKRQATDWEKTLQITYLTKELYPKLSNLNNQKTETQLKNARET